MERHEQITEKYDRLQTTAINDEFFGKLSLKVVLDPEKGMI
jgi:hypothetical protein